MAGAGGLLSIATANIDQWQGPRIVAANLAEMSLWMMFAASFVFVGASLVRWRGLREVAEMTAVTLACVVIASTISLIWNGAQVRALDNIGRAYLNVSLMGIPIFGTFGVNSAAPYFAISAGVLIGALYGVRGPARFYLVAAALPLAVFIAVGSDSRATQIQIIVQIGIFALAAIVFRLPWRRSLSVIALVMLGGALALSSTLMKGATSRFALTVSDIAKSNEVKSEAPQSSEEAAANPGAKRSEEIAAADLDRITTGRTKIWEVAIQEWRSRPFVGNGFSGFGRFASVPAEFKVNTTAHSYMLNALWKGGLVFLLPFLFFIGSSLFLAYKNWRPSPEAFAFLSVVISVFTAQSLFWDYLILPSGGSLVWYMLGALTTQPRT